MVLMMSLSGMLEIKQDYTEIQGEICKRFELCKCNSSYCNNRYTAIISTSIYSPKLINTRKSKLCTMKQYKSTPMLMLKVDHIRVLPPMISLFGYEDAVSEL